MTRTISKIKTVKDRGVITTNPLANTTLARRVQIKQQSGKLATKAISLRQCKSRIFVSCDVTIFCSARAIHPIPEEGEGKGTSRKIGWGVRYASRNPYPISDQNL